MANVQLNVPVLTGGILNTNFFNGRVLAAEDLTALQTANARQRRQLGRAIGDGVACGLEVTLGASADPNTTMLHVTAGLALDRKGDAIALSTDVDVAITTTAQVQSATNGLFAACTPEQATVATNLDCYILTISPASGLQGSAPMTSALSCGFAPSCASANVVEGVQFGLLPLGVASTSNTTPLRGQALQLNTVLAPEFITLAGLTDTAAIAAQQAQIAPTLSQFQNAVAHLCFGTDVLQNFPTNPFALTDGDSSYAEYGVLDDLRAQGYLKDCAVPLALVYWTTAGVQFVDMWSVRRPVFPAAASEMWPVFSSRRRMAEGLAMFLQFQAQLNGLLQSTTSTTALTSIAATNYFQFLPAAGILPLAGAQSLTGFSYPQFFSNCTYPCAQKSTGACTPLFIEGAKIAPLLHQSLLYPPINLGNKEMIWLYWVRENMQPATGQTSTAQPYVAFANGHIPNQGNAQFDLNYWNYANFVL